MRIDIEVYMQHETITILIAEGELEHFEDIVIEHKKKGELLLVKDTHGKTWMINLNYVTCIKLYEK